MHYGDNEHQYTRQPDDVCAPSSLLPDVLQRIGLGEEQKQTRPLAAIIVDLAHPEWYIRAAAVRTLGTLGQQAPLEGLIAALDDPHVTVRASAVHALGLQGERAPVDKLVQALSDVEWQVRESAIRALAALGERAPARPLMSALQDQDGIVREAAQAALRQIRSDVASQDISSLPVVERNRLGGQHHSLFENSNTQHKKVIHLFFNGEQMKNHVSMKGKTMHETDYYQERVEGSPHKEGESKPPRRTLRRSIGIAVAVVFVLVNIVAWTFISHTLQRNGHTMTGAGTAATTSASWRNGSPGKTLYTYQSADPTSRGELMSVGWSPTGKSLAVSALDVVLLDANNDHVQNTYDTDTGGSMWVSWSPDGKKLAVSSHDVKIQDAQTGSTLVTYTPSTGNPRVALSGGDMIYDSAWSPDGKFVASAVNGISYGHNVQVWDAANGHYVRTLTIKANADPTYYIDHVAWSPDGKYIAASVDPSNVSAEVLVWNAATGELVHTQQGVGELTWSPDSKYIASVATDHSTVRIWNAVTGQVTLSFPGQLPAQGQQAASWFGVNALAWSPDGKYIAAAGENVRIWDVQQNKLFYTYTGQGTGQYYTIKSLAWSPDSTRIASLGTGTEVTASHADIPLGNVNVWVAE